MSTAQKTLAQWEFLAQRYCRQLLRKAQNLPTLQKKGPASLWEVEVILSGIEKMKQINKKYRKKSIPTDVLSFPAPQLFFEKGQLGSLIICFPILKKQAKRESHSISKELKILLAHGILHLLGMDHERGERQAVQMASLEKKLLGYPFLGLLERAH